MWQVNFLGFRDIFCITKSNKVILLQNVTGCYYKVSQVLERVTDCYYKVRQVYEMWQTLLQSASGITKCDNYYKVRRNRGGIYPDGNL